MECACRNRAGAGLFAGLAGNNTGRPAPAACRRSAGADRVGRGCADAGRRRRWTYHELLLAAETVAGALLRRFKPGERVAVWSPNSAEWVLLQQGASLAGLVLVTVNPAYLAAELEHVLATSMAAGIFYSDDVSWP